MTGSGPGILHRCAREVVPATNCYGIRTAAAGVMTLHDATLAVEACIARRYEHGKSLKSS